MKVFLKWFLGSILLLLVMAILPVISSDHGKLHYLEGLIFIIIGSFLLACLFYYFEVKFIPRRKERLINKIIDIFGSYPVKESITRFKINNLYIYTEVKIQLLLLGHHGYTERIEFHVPQKQIDSLPYKPPFSLKKSSCNGIETYLIYEAGGRGLERTKQRLEKKVGEILRLPLT